MKIISNIILLIMIISFFSCNEKNKYVQGKRIYDAVCANCHMEDGQGLGSMFPPIANSDYLKKNWEELPCIIKKGMHQEIIVNGIKFNEEMPAHKKMKDAELANLINYIQSTWYEHPKTISIKTIKKQLTNCN